MTTMHTHDPSYTRDLLDAIAYADTDGMPAAVLLKRVASIIGMTYVDDDALDPEAQALARMAVADAAQAAQAASKALADAQQQQATLDAVLVGATDVTAAPRAAYLAAMRGIIAIGTIHLASVIMILQVMEQLHSEHSADAYGDDILTHLRGMLAEAAAEAQAAEPAYDPYEHAEPDYDDQA